MWGWNPESFEAVGTVAASFIAVIALLNGLRVRQTDRKDARALLANQVSVSLLVDEEGRANRKEGSTVQPLVLSVTNRGQHPIYRTTITSKARAAYFWREAPAFSDIFAYPTESCLHNMYVHGWKVRWGIYFEGKKTMVAPGETVLFHFGMNTNPHISISFRDENGRGWIKYPSGALAEIRSSPPNNRIVTWV